MPRVQHITYATTKFRGTSLMLACSARRRSLGRTRIYRPTDPLVRDLATRYPERMSQPRGAGLWLWKPFIIADALARARDGDTVLYTDAGMRFIADPAPLIQLAQTHPVVLFEHDPHTMPMRHWTKRDCFVALDADTPHFWEAPQLLSGFQLYRACPAARDFIADLCRMMTTPAVLEDGPNTLGKPDLEGFRAHRHDQSVLSILARRRAVPFFPDPSDPNRPLPRAAIENAGDGIARPAAPYAKVFDLHRLNGKRFRVWYLKHLLRTRSLC